MTGPTLRRLVLLCVTTCLAELAPAVAEAGARRSSPALSRGGRGKAARLHRSRAARRRLAHCKATPRCNARLRAIHERHAQLSAPARLDLLLAKTGATADLSAVDAAAEKLRRTSVEEQSAAPRATAAAAQSLAIAPRRSRSIAAPNVALEARAGPAVTPLAGVGSTRGSLPREALRKVLDRVEPLVRACYERATLRGPAMAGRITAELTVAPSGLVTAVDTSASTLTDQTVMACVQRAVSRARFPQPDSGEPMVVEYYWDLSAG